MALASGGVVVLGGCSREDRSDGARTATTTAAAPTAGATGTPAPGIAKSALPEVMPEPRCPPDMVKVRPAAVVAVDGGIGADGGTLWPYCIDRYEAMLVDARSGARISPYYSPSRKWASYAAEVWESKRFTVGGPKAQAMPLPALPAWEREREFEPRAVVRKGVTPNGHTSGQQARTACRNAGKRLCTPSEWRVACGGERGYKYPYGPEYVSGQCNVFREGHPAAVLHDDASMGHADPRLNQVAVGGRPLLRRTGATPSCASRWGDDAVYDLVGNLDEWVEHPTGSFAGGFYSRSTRDGCDWRTSAHPDLYADYSTGVRCCADLPDG
jgi:hypothetical protein